MNWRKISKDFKLSWNEIDRSTVTQKHCTKAQLHDKAFLSRRTEDRCVWVNEWMGGWATASFQKWLYGYFVSIWSEGGQYNMYSTVQYVQTLTHTVRRIWTLNSTYFTVPDRMYSASSSLPRLVNVYVNVNTRNWTPNLELQLATLYLTSPCKS